MSTSTRMKKEEKITPEEVGERTIPVRVSRSLYSDARRTARAEQRTIAGQI
ncbi:MAG: hypothetical protein WCY56_05695 [Aminobacteriaceae bacterium]